MTNEEAIRSIEDVLNSEYYYDESLGYQLTSDDFEWLEKAKETLEKQIPKKPKQDKEYPLGRVCPRCCCYLGNVQFVPNNYLYCQRCGQAIDWSEENEK